jgi:hypothetical protein
MRKLLRKIILWALGAEKNDKELRALIVRALASEQYKHDPAPLDRNGE